MNKASQAEQGYPYPKIKKKQDLVFSVKLRFLRLEKMPKNDCPKMSKSYGYPKQTIMVQKRPFFEPKSKPKSKIHQELWNKGLYFYELYKKFKENKGNLIILYFYLRKWTEIWCQKGLFYSFSSKKVTFLGFLRAKYNSKWMKMVIVMHWNYHIFTKNIDIGTVHC